MTKLAQGFSGHRAAVKLLEERRKRTNQEDKEAVKTVFDDVLRQNLAILPLQIYFILQSPFSPSNSKSPKDFDPLHNCLVILLSRKNQKRHIYGERQTGKES